MSRAIHPLTLIIRRPAAVGILSLGVMLGACQDDSLPTVTPAPRALASKGGSKSGESVLFVSLKDGRQHIYSMNPDGSNVQQVTADSSSDDNPDFAPDNRKFVFIRYRGIGLSELFIANVDGTKATQLTTMGTYVMQPRYSPDGSKIAFVAYSSDNGGFDIYSINSDGTGLKRLTYESSLDKSPTWSPDGQQIAFDSDRANPGCPFVYLMTADGLNVRLLPGNDAGCISEPAWSPDGAQIAVAGPGAALFVVRVLTQTMAPIGPLFTDGESEHPTWSKDSKLVLFASSRGIEGTYEIYASPPGTTDPVRRLTVFSPTHALRPSYSH